MNLQELIYQNYDKLSETDLYIWQYIDHHKEECRNISIQELAKKCNVSHSSILRLAQKIGLDGFSELKILIKWNFENRKFSSHSISNIKKELKDSIDQLADDDFSKIIQNIHQARRIHIYPTGDVQTNVAEEFKKDFTFQKKLMNVIEGASELDSILKSISSDDFFIIISFSGNNASAIILAKLLRKLEVKSLGIALDNGNPLSKYCTDFIGFKSTPFNTPSNQHQQWCPTHLFLIEYFLYLKYIEFVSNQK